VVWIVTHSFCSYFPVIYQCLRVAIDLHSYTVTIGQTCRARVYSSVVHQVRPATCSRVLADRPPISVSVYGEERLTPGRWVRLRKFFSRQKTYFLNMNTESKRLTTPQYEADPGGRGFCAMNGGEAPSTTGKETVCRNVFPGTQGLSFPLIIVMYVLDVEQGVLVQAYIPVTFLLRQIETFQMDSRIECRIRREAR